MRLSPALVAAASLLLSGCFNEKVPAGVQIACTTNADCPTGHVCRTVIGRCVPNDSLDQTPPALEGTPAIAPAVARAGVTLTVEFKVSEALAADPVVRVAGRQLAVDEAGTDRAALAFRFSTVVAGNEPQGEPVPVTVDLVDNGGNSAAGLSAGTALFDFTPPSLLTAGAISPAVASAGAEVQVTFVVSEALGADPEVSMVDEAGAAQGVSWTLSRNDGSGSYTYRYVPTGDEAEGRWQVTAVATDLAGNVSLALGLGTAVFDFKVPQIVSVQVDPSPTPVRPGQIALVTVTLDEPSATTPALAGADGDRSLAFDLVRQTREVLVFQHVAASGEDGRYTLTLSGVADLATNALAAQALVETLTIDGTPPGLASYTQSAAELNGKETLVVEFSATEALGEAPLVRFGNLAMAREGTGETPYRYSLPMQNTGLLGDFAVQVALFDLAGNSALLEPGVVQVDAVLPGLIDAQFSPPVARLGITAYLTVTVSELLASPPVLTWEATGGDPGFTFATRSGQAYVYSLPVTAGVAPGVYRLDTATLVDVAGNDVVRKADGVGMAVDFTVDNTPPKISLLQANGARFSAQAGFDELTVSFQVSKPLAAPGGIEVLVGARAASCAVQGGGYLCTYRVLGTETEGPTLIKVTATDAAGNAGFESASVVFDFTPPALVYSAASPVLAKRGDDVIYALSASEPLGAQPALAVAGPGTVELTYTGNPYVYRHRVVPADTDGTYTVSIDLVDVVGNQATSLEGAGLELDASVPSISGLQVERDRYSAQEGFDEVVVTLQVSEALAPPGLLQLSVGGRAASCDATGTSHRCTYRVLGDEPEGQAVVGATATDAAGNVGQASRSLTLDFSPPRLVEGTAELRLVPPPGCLIDQVTALGAGATAQVRFSLDEPVAPGQKPTVEAQGPGTLPFAWQSGESSAFVYAHTLDLGAHAQGGHAVHVAAVDAVGNLASFALPLAAPGLVVDTAPPAPLSAQAREKLLYTRKPWGTDDTAGAKAYTVEGLAAGLFEAGASILAWDGPDPFRANLLGRSQAAADGALPRTSLARWDNPAVYLSQVDGACNLDGAMATAAGLVDWVATLGGKRIGSLFENPHRLHEASVFLPSLSRSGALEVEGARLAEADGVAQQTAGRGSWRLWRRSAPTARYSPGVAFDAARGRAVLFGGEGSGGRKSDLWEWDGESWLLTEPLDPEQDGNPEARDLHAMAYDAARGKVVTFGGATDRGPLADTWEWDGSSWRRVIPLDPEGDGNPSARYGYGMAYDPVAGVILLVGEDASTEPAGTLWSYDGTSWRATVPSDPEGDGDPTGWLLQAAWDRARSRLVLFDGTRLWAWTGGSWAVEDGSVLPVPRSEASMAYDASRDRLVVFGGVGFDPDTGLDQELGDALEWDGSGWSVVPDAGPAPRARAAFVYDPGARSLLMFGGFDWDDASWGYVFFDDTWAFDGAFEQLGPADPEGDGDPDLGAGLASDSAGAGHVLVSSPGSGTWAWTGSSWQFAPLQDPEGDGSPLTPAYAAPEVAFDAARQRLVQFGGTHGDPRTWEWDGTSWRSVAPSDPEGDGSPTARYGHVMAYDSVRGVVVMQGGVTSGRTGETWLWNGASWRRAAVGPAVNAAAMAFDAVSGRMILHGGYSASGATDATWAFDGTSWTKLAPGDPEGDGDPSPRAAHAMAYDPVRKKVLLLGGMNNSQPFDSGLWEWTGSSWAHLDACDPEGDGSPSAHASHSLVFDPVRGRAMLFGGMSSSDDPDDLWLYDVREKDRPAHQLDVDFGASGAPAGSQVIEVAARVVAGGNGLISQAPVAGAALFAWERGEWSTMGSNGAGGSAPADVSFTVADPLRLPRLFLDDHLRLAAAPLGVNGSGRARISTDYAEVRVRYRVP